MGNETVDYILNQTELSTIFLSGEMVDKVIAMKKANLGKTVKCIVNYDNSYTPAQI